MKAGSEFRVSKGSDPKSVSGCLLQDGNLVIFLEGRIRIGSINDRIRKFESEIASPEYLDSLSFNFEVKSWRFPRNHLEFVIKELDFQHCTILDQIQDNLSN